MFNQYMSPQYWLSVLYSVPAVLLALSFHEWAHAWAAYRCGDPTARNMGRMSFDPLRHLDPVGTICLLFFRFGWAKPVPVNPRYFRHPRRDEVIVSLAGIIMNFILSFIAYGILFTATQVFHWYNAIFLNIMQPVVTLNITLGIFNLIPIPPLDGFHVAEVLFPRAMHRFGEAVGRYGMLILVMLLVSGVVGWVLNGFTTWLLSVYAGFWGLFA